MNLMTARRSGGKRKASLAPASLALMSMLMIAAGCGVKEMPADNASNATNATTGSGIVDSSSDVSPDSAGEPVAQATPTPGNSEKAAASGDPVTQSEEQQASGTFNGLADGHSVEIKTPTDTVVFQAGSELVQQMQAFEQGTSVDYTYIVKEVDGGTDGKIKQPWLVSIKEAS
ncbi:hypothetical protein HGI30_06720 [Paenibacillus albicereus]|uniref:DUF3221 domain-containing protein n=1 Tax=Paenibacillus albicereus TaxID=2726185 RepID=A0A6H2GVU6_9BACL|nr:hypothetical protein [Paenibacillus albicereus]QJC51268.1 hypothetical protein HGI30_06720 [Paenibacillus albicereus]